MKLLYVYIFTLLGLVLLSYGFIDPNFPYQPFPSYFQFLHDFRSFTTIVYTTLMALFFLSYGLFLRSAYQKKITLRGAWKLIALTAGILFFAYPAFSSDIFNYIATAKVTYLYRENPYIVMPIEIPNDPMLHYLHASNKVALYGWSWILLTGIPYSFGFGNIVLQILTMKVTVLLFYVWLLTLITRLSDNKVWSLVFFGLNPLIVMETVVAVHNDIVMMALVLLSIELATRRRWTLSLMALVVSILIKGATVVLIPHMTYIWMMMRKGKSVNWRGLWYWGMIAMGAVFVLSPLREEMYPWYFIWVLTFASLLPANNFFVPFMAVTSIGLEYRIAPYLFTWRWDGVTPRIKQLVSIVPPGVFSLWYAFRKKI